MTTNPTDPATPPGEGVEELAAERRPSPAAQGAPTPTRRSVPLAWMVALGADFVQIIAFPFFMEGIASPINDVLDVVVAAVLIRLVGWHWAFLPTLVAELIPGVDLVPTWTVAMWIASRRKP